MCALFRAVIPPSETASPASAAPRRTIIASLATRPPTATTHPPTTSALGYDPDGNLLIWQDENGSATYAKYDAINRRVAMRVFRAGRRKGQSPYGRLGLVLPAGRWWDLIKKTPEQLRQQLSAPGVAA